VAGGLVAADLPRERDVEGVAFVAADGTEVVSAGLDRPGVAELEPGPPVDLAALAAELRPPAETAHTPLRPALAAIAVLLLLLGSVKSGARPTR
jgi:hypothetical protein